MGTKMHRLQISLPHRQARYLEERARLAGVSMAEVIRRLLEREASLVLSSGTVDGIWSIAGIAEDHRPLIGGIAVSESPALYLATASTDSTSTSKQARGKRKRRS